MGRGKGGSKSHGKRTPGGISTSSAMKMSAVGEIEAKHGVLGDNDTASVGGLRPISEQAFVEKNTHELLDAIATMALEKQGAPVNDANKQAFLGSEQGRVAAESVREDIAALADRGKKFAEVQPTASNYISTGREELKSLVEPSNRTAAELEKMIEVIEARKGLSSAGEIERELYSAAKQEPSNQKDAKDLFLRVHGLLREASDTHASLESIIKPHLVLNGGKVEATPEEVKLSGYSSFFADLGSLVNNLTAYKALVGSKTGQELLQRMARGDLKNGSVRPPYHRGAALSLSEAESLENNAHSIKKINHKNIDGIREAFGLQAVSMPEYAKESLEKQPVADKLFRLVYDEETPESISEVHSHSSDKRVERYVQKFKESEYGQIAGITDLEGYALVAYTTSGYDTINSYLRDMESYLARYDSEEDEEIKAAYGRRIKYLLTEKKADRALASAFMSGAMKILAENRKQGKEPYVVTRGALIPHSIGEGQYFYDAGVSSTSLNPNYKSKWEHNRDQFVLVTDRAIDMRPLTGFPEEQEYAVLPGVMFKADLTTTYSPGTGASAGERQVTVGRQANIGSENAPELLVAKGTWQGIPGVNKMQESFNRDEAIQNYESRYDEATDLVAWLLGERRASRV